MEMNSFSNSTTFSICYVIGNGAGHGGTTVSKAEMIPALKNI